jgi:exopolysaccharide biosynthesis polyprenyl glycosylphosphotransferase
MSLNHNPIKHNQDSLNNLLNNLWQILLSIFNLLLNPNHLIFRNNFQPKILENLRDIRAANALRIGGWTTIHSLRILLVVFFDCLMLVLAWTTAEQLGTETESINLFRQSDFQLTWLIIVLTVNTTTFFASNLYGIDRQSHSLSNLLKSLSLAHISLFLIAFLITPQLLVSRFVFLGAWFLALLFVTTERWLIKLAITKIREKITSLRRKVIFLGKEEDLDKAQKIIGENKNFEVVDLVDLSTYEQSKKWNKIIERITEREVDEILICSWENLEKQIVLFWQLQSLGINWRIIPVNLRLPYNWSDISMIGNMPTFRFHAPAIIGADFWLKRIFDIVISSILLALLSLPMLLISWLIKLDSPGAVFYKQTRIGLKGRQFEIWKFRTMVENASALQKDLEANNEIKGGILFKIQDDPRITKLGKFLRRYSLDELPQLFNVLRGEMSLVGPRPLPIRDVSKFAPEHFLRQEVLPGITGLWQVSGRSNTDSEAVFSWDFIYIQNWSFWLDLQILLKTIKVVLLTKGAY